MQTFGITVTAVVARTFETDDHGLLHLRVVLTDAEYCGTGCTCGCHQVNYSEYRDLYSISTRIALAGYSISSWVTQDCTQRTCYRCHPSASYTVFYKFPDWYIRHIVHHFTTAANLSRSLELPRLVEAEAKIFQHVKIGDLRTIQELFGYGQASCWDVDEQGQTLLHVRIF